MRVLALDTTTRGGSVAVVEDGCVLVEHAGNAAQTHAERLPRELLEALAASSLTPQDIDLFAVASGPGSFTGIRIGIATVQGLALVRARPVAAVSALRALGEVGAAGQPAGTRVGAWMDAYRRDVFSALYDVVVPSTDSRAAVLSEVEDPRVGLPTATMERWLSVGPPVVICGDGAALYRTSVPDGIVVLDTPALASYIGRLAPDSTPGSPASARPFYVRRPDVELAREKAAALQR